MANVLMWCAYDISTMSYTAAAFDAEFAVSNMIGSACIFYGRYKERKQATEEAD